jgi:hypothetical protein
MYFKYNHRLSEITYNIENLEMWSSICTIVHFFGRLGMLMRTHQIDRELVAFEFKEVALYWFAHLSHIYNSRNDEAATHATFVAALRMMGCTENDINNFYLGPGASDRRDRRILRRAAICPHPSSLASEPPER